MARDKLITIRIEGEKREAFNNLAKSQNTDTASVLYDFISGCLDGKIDIGIVTGKKQWIDKIDNQLDSDRIDRLEATTQEIDNRLDKLSKKLTDWVVSFDDCLNDCDRELISLEHRLTALASQLDSQRDSQLIDTDRQKDSHKDSHQIDTDSQEIDDMDYLLKRERECSIASPLPPIEETSPLPPLAQPAIGTLAAEVPPSPPDAIKSLPTVETDSSIETVASAIETDDREWLTLKQVADKKIKGLPGTHQGLRPYAKNWESRKNPTKQGKQYKIPKEYL